MPGAKRESDERLLQALHLRDLGWTQVRIAEALGFGSVASLGNTLRKIDAATDEQGCARRREG